MTAPTVNVPGRSDDVRIGGGSVHWARDVAPGEMLRDDKHCVITRAALESIADYTQSRPTGPSPGRIYRKNLHWSGPPSNWFVYICEPDAEPGFTLHRGLPVLLVD